MKKIYLNLILIPCLLLMGINNLQAQSYTYSMHTDTYNELVSPTVVTTSILGAAYITNINNMQFNLYGETFVLDGSAGLAIGENSFISATNTRGDRAFAFDALLASYTNHSTLSTEISYTVDFSTSGSILKVQYKNMGISTGSATDFVNFQIWVYQGTGDIEYRYGPSSTSSSTFGSGVPGPAIGIFLAENDFSQVYETQFLVGAASNPTVDHATPFASIIGMPANGTVYRFSNSAPVSISENQLENISLFPNPATTNLTVEGNGQIDRIEIIDMLGKTVLSKELNNNTKTINIRSLNKGLYLARIYTNSGISTARFMKQ